MNDGEIGFTTFRIKDDFETPARVVAAFARAKKDANGDIVFLAQFAYCSPKERESDKNMGRFIASSRLFANNERGAIPFSLPENFKPREFRECLRQLILREADRKKVRWLAGKTSDDLI